MIKLKVSIKRKLRKVKGGRIKRLGIKKKQSNIDEVRKKESAKTIDG